MYTFSYHRFLLEEMAETERIMRDKRPIPERPPTSHGRSIRPKH
mgnify:CR=1 FL=1